MATNQGVDAPPPDFQEYPGNIPEDDEFEEEFYESSGDDPVASSSTTTTVSSTTTTSSSTTTMVTKISLGEESKSGSDSQSTKGMLTPGSSSINSPPSASIKSDSESVAPIPGKVNPMDKNPIQKKRLGSKRGGKRRMNSKKQSKTKSPLLPNSSVDSSSPSPIGISGSGMITLQSIPLHVLTTTFWLQSPSSQTGCLWSFP